MAKPTPEEVQKRFDRITEIFSGIVTQADTQASTRCPYRNRHDLCTAKFRCGNQEPVRGQEIVRGQAATEEMACTHDGQFDYRSAWESDPRASDKARQRIRKQQHRPASAPPTPS